MLNELGAAAPSPAEDTATPKEPTPTWKRITTYVLAVVLITAGALGLMPSDMANKGAMTAGVTLAATQLLEDYPEARKPMMQVSVILEHTLSDPAIPEDPHSVTERVHEAIAPMGAAAGPVSMLVQHELASAAAGSQGSMTVYRERLRALAAGIRQALMLSAPAVSEEE